VQNLTKFEHGTEIGKKERFAKVALRNDAHSWALGRRQHAPHILFFGWLH
jgi:hypothetical protein